MNEDHGIIVFVFFVIVLGVGGIYLSDEHAKLINECERHLPRDKHCKLIAVIDEEK